MEGGMEATNRPLSDRPVDSRQRQGDGARLAVCTMQRPPRLTVPEWTSITSPPRHRGATRISRVRIETVSSVVDVAPALRYAYVCVCVLGMGWGGVGGGGLALLCASHSCQLLRFGADGYTDKQKKKERNEKYTTLSRSAVSDSCLAAIGIQAVFALSIHGAGCGQKKKANSKGG